MPFERNSTIQGIQDLGCLGINRQQIDSLVQFRIDFQPLPLLFPRQPGTLFGNLKFFFFQNSPSSLSLFSSIRLPYDRAQHRFARAIPCAFSELGDPAGNDTKLSKLTFRTEFQRMSGSLTSATFLARISNMVRRKYRPGVVHSCPLHSKPSAH